MTRSGPVPSAEVPLPPKGPWHSWSGPGPSGDGEQVVNAHEDFVDLTPVSQAPYEQLKTNWAALLPSTDEEDLSGDQDQ